MRLHHLVASLIVISLTGCAYVGETSPSPSAVASPTNAPPATTGAPVPVATFTQAPVLSAAPQTSTSPTQQPTPTPTLEPAPTTEPSRTGWQRIPDFPPSNARVRALTAFDGGFVAVGGSGATDACDSATQARIWTSPDGLSWSAASLDLDRLSLFDVAVAGGAVYAFGSEQSRGCSIERYVVARSTNGSEWRIDDVQTHGDQYFNDFVGVGDRLLGFGEAYDEEGRALGSVWISDDGIDWRVSQDNIESGFELESAVAVGDTVALADYAARPIWLSTDAGDTWRRAEFGPMYAAYPLRLAASDARFVAVGHACCMAPDDTVGFAINSEDGNSWSESEPFGFRQIPDAIVGLADGFVTIGRQSWLSQDGSSWVIGPDLPGYEIDPDYYLPSGALSGDRVVVVNRTQAWVASASELDPSGFSDTPRLAERPAIGSSWQYDAFTHCGWPDVHVDLRAWVPDPPFHDPNGNPPQGVKEFDHGTLTFVSQNRLEYEAESGQIIVLVPSDEPTLSGPCA
ncbi:MAG TPA: hypothetical protein VMZ33_00940 [Candidatus Limnocylindrales bacterium]|nr:hypothetical protein [Candidatus Limnocylindrales bacterium]